MDLIGSEALPALISDLTSSESEDDRMKTKARFTEHYHVLETKLNLLVYKNSSNLSNVVESTSKVINVISDSKAKCQDLKNRLTLCKEKLQCKRDEIRKLWLDSLGHKHVHQMLTEVEKITKIPEKVNKHLNSKKYICATEVLMSSVSLLEGNFSDVEGLKDLRLELNRFKDKLYSIFTEELRQELYWSTFHLVYNATCADNDKIVTYEKIFQNRILKGMGSLCLNSAYVKVLLECLALLQQWPEALEFLKEECQSELNNIVQKLSKLMFDILQKSIEGRLFDLPESNQQSFLVDLLETVFDHFRCIVSNHREFLSVLENVIPNASSHESYMQVSDLYSDIQITIEQFVSTYLEQQSLENTSCSSNVSVFSCSQKLSDVSSFFEIYTNKECPTLFSFANSSFGLRKNRKNTEHHPKPNYSSADTNLKNLILVCKPTLKNITFIFVPLKQFVSEIESLLNLEFHTHCPLHTFLYDSALAFLDQVNSEINTILENASVCLQSWNMSAIPGDELDSEKQILSSTLILNNNLKELQLLMKTLPDYSKHFLHLINYVILDYKEMLQKGFKSLFGEDHNILSVSWAKDRDIRRLLKSFSNWKHLEDAKTGEAIAFPEEIRLRNKEESQLLMRNLHSEEHGSWEMITDFNVLLNLAVLQESSQWFSVQLLKFTTELFKDGIYSDYELSSAVVVLNKLVKEYEDFADVCLLTLHLEVRAHCFYYLLPPSHLGVTLDTFFSQNFESSVQNLTVDLAKIDESLHSALTTKELKYIFEGIGELVASILIHNVSILNSTSESLVKVISRCIFVIQCCLSNITLAREVALERTRQYIQLLNQTCDDILNEIMEEGPVFSERKYASLFRLILGRDSGANEHLLDSYVTKLQNIFKRISVTI